MEREKKENTLPHSNGHGGVVMIIRVFYLVKEAAKHHVF
jgi:hypothetical protein